MSLPRQWQTDDHVSIVGPRGDHRGTGNVRSIDHNRGVALVEMEDPEPYLLDFPLHWLVLI